MPLVCAAALAAGGPRPGCAPVASDYGLPPSIYPYLVLDDYARHRRPGVMRTAVLENERIRAEFALDLGGRLWSLRELPSGRELLYTSPALQPANLALRNAWFAGGVEWNIGTRGHSPTTCAPGRPSQCLTRRRRHCRVRN